MLDKKLFNISSPLAQQIGHPLGSHWDSTGFITTDGAVIMFLELDIREYTGRNMKKYKPEIHYFLSNYA